MTIIFTKHARQRFEQRARLNIDAGYRFVSKAYNNPITTYEIEKYKNIQTDPTLTVIGYKHLMFVVRIIENKIFVITVLVAH